MIWRLAWAFLVFAQSTANASDDRLKISVYRVSEQDACGPSGYPPNSSGQIGRACPIQMNPRRFERLLRDQRLTLIKQNVYVPPSQITLSERELRPVVQYSEVAGQLSLARREAALLVIEWPEKKLRNFRLDRPASSNTPARKKPYVLPAAQYRKIFYHEPLEHLDPDNKSVWRISSGSSKHSLTIRTQP